MAAKIRQKKSGTRKARKVRVKVEKAPSKRGLPIVEKLDAEQRRLVALLDGFEKKKEEAEKGLQEGLQALLVSLGGSASFMHPTKGPTTIMSRKGLMFWRSKPIGRYTA